MFRVKNYCVYVISTEGIRIGILGSSMWSGDNPHELSAELLEKSYNFPYISVGVEEVVVYPRQGFSSLRPIKFLKSATPEGVDIHNLKSDEQLVNNKLRNFLEEIMNNHQSLNKITVEYNNATVSFVPR
jgi:hypothetical protein